MLLAATMASMKLILIEEVPKIRDTWLGGYTVIYWQAPGMLKTDPFLRADPWVNGVAGRCQKWMVLVHFS